MAKFIAQLARMIIIGTFEWRRYRKGDYFEGIFIQTKKLDNSNGYSVWVRLGIKSLPMREIIRYEFENRQLTLTSTINL